MSDGTWSESVVKQRFVLQDTIHPAFILHGIEYIDGDIMITDGESEESGKVYFTKEQLEALEGFLALRKHK